MPQECSLFFWAIFAPVEVYWKPLDKSTLKAIIEYIQYKYLNHRITSWNVENFTLTSAFENFTKFNLFQNLSYWRNNHSFIQCSIHSVNSAFQHCLQNWGYKDTKITFCCYVGFFSAFFLINSVILFYSWQPGPVWVHLSFFSYFWLLNLVLSSTYRLYYLFSYLWFPSKI